MLDAEKTDASAEICPGELGRGVMHSLVIHAREFELYPASEEKGSGILGNQIAESVVSHGIVVVCLGQFCSWGYVTGPPIAVRFLL